MQPREKISKSSWTLLEGIKDSVANNITNAIRSGQLKIETKQVQTLLALLGSSADEGYHRAHKTFMKTVDGVIAESLADGAIDVQFQALPGTRPKKK